MKLTTAFLLLSFVPSLVIGMENKGYLRDNSIRCHSLSSIKKEIEPLLIWAYSLKKEPHSVPLDNLKKELTLEQIYLLKEISDARYKSEIAWPIRCRYLVNLTLESDREIFKTLDPHLQKVLGLYIYKPTLPQTSN